MTQAVKILAREGVTEITLAAPEAGNQIAPEMAERIEAALADLAPQARLVVLKAEGPDFCRGRVPPPIDRATATAMTFREQVAEGPLRLYDAFRSCRAPILGLVGGRALGVGCALAALCDITIAAEDATFGIPEMNHGIPPTLVISALADRVPLKAIGLLVYSRRAISAHHALRIGLVSEVVPAMELEAAGARMEAAMLENASAMALQGVKEYLRHAPSLDPAARNALAGALIATIQASQHR